MSLDPQIGSSGGGLYPATTQSKPVQPLGSNWIGEAPATLLASWAQDSSGVLTGVTGPDGVLATGTAGLARQLAGSVSTASAASIAVSTPNGSMAAITLSADTVISFPTATSGELFRFRLGIIQDTTGFWVFTLPASVTWIDNSRPVPPVIAGSAAVYDFFTVDGGTTWLASEVSNPTAIQVYDDFVRADDPLSMGSTLTGQAWTADAGTWGIISNSAYEPTRVADDIVRTTTTASDLDIRVRITPGASAANAGIIFRYTDASNYLLLVLSENTNTMDLFRRVAGTYTNISSTAAVINVGINYQVRITAVAQVITTYLNGVLVKADTGVSQHETATGVGFRINDANSVLTRYNNLMVVAA